MGYRLYFALRCPALVRRVVLQDLDLASGQQFQEASSRNSCTTKNRSMRLTRWHYLCTHCLVARYAAVAVVLARPSRLCSGKE